jgi:hypothetical protein
MRHVAKDRDKGMVRRGWPIAREVYESSSGVAAEAA